MSSHSQSSKLSFGTELSLVELSDLTKNLIGLLAEVKSGGSIPQNIEGLAKTFDAQLRIAETSQISPPPLATDGPSAFSRIVSSPKKQTDTTQNSYVMPAASSPTGAVRETFPVPPPLLPVLGLPPSAVVVPASIPPYRFTFQTNPAEHFGSAIQSILFSDHFEGLATDHDGWLISTSPKLINLWQRPRGTSPDLALWHSQIMEERIMAMDIARTTNVLVAAAVDVSTNRPGISVYSLDSDSFLASRGRVQTTMQVSQVCSLQEFGSNLKHLIATAYKGEVVVFDLSKEGSKPQANFQAHAETISHISRRKYANTSICTGCVGGAVHIWDMRSKPTAPAVKLLQHFRPITSVDSMDPNLLLTSSADSHILQWDVRNATTPLKSFIPDAKSVLSLKVNSTSTHAAISTLKGVYCLDLTKDEMFCLTSADQKITCPQVTWNDRTNEIYACRLSGEVDVYTATTQ